MKAVMLAFARTAGYNWIRVSTTSLRWDKEETEACTCGCARVSARHATEAKLCQNLLTLNKSVH